MSPRRARGSSFGTVIKVATGFGIRWWEGDRRRKQSGFRTRGDATEALARVRAGLSDGTLIAKRGGAVTFSQAAQEWLTLHSKTNLRSHQDNLERYTKHVQPVFGGLPLAAITPARILELRSKLQAEKKIVGTENTLAEGEQPIIRPALSAGTINRVMALIRCILKFAVVNGYLQTSPTDRIGRGKLMIKGPKTKLEPPVHSAEDVGRLLAAVREIGREKNRPWLYGLFATMAYTGLRRGEACGLRWSDVDLSRRIMAVRHSYDGWTKSGQERLVPIPVELVPILERHRKEDEYGGELVFPGDDGEMMSKDASLGDWLHQACDRAKLPRIRVHDLRHVYASYFVMAGGELYSLQKILGHSSPQITAETYAHLAPGHFVGLADRVSYKEPTQGGGKLLRLPEKKPVG